MEAKDIIKPENLVYQKSRLMSDATFNFCPGCGHGVVVRTIAEVIGELPVHPIEQTKVQSKIKVSF